MARLVETVLALIMWMLTLVRFRDMFLRNAQKANQGISRVVFTILLFGSITLTCKIDVFAQFFDDHTLPNLSLLLTHLSFLIGQYFLTTTTLAIIGTISTRRVIFWIKTVLLLLIGALLILYILFISKLPPYLDADPQSLPIVIFKFLSYPFGILLCCLMLVTYLVYLPSEKFSVMRLRAVMIILANLLGGIFILLRMVIFAGYFWPFLLSESLLTLSNVLLFFAVILFFGALLSDKIYVGFVVVSGSIESWHAFRDLKYLMDGLALLCPVIALPTNHPPFWKFLFNPEYYLYRAVIIILDGKTMLADFLSESAEPGEPAMWDGELWLEAVRVDRALQSANPSNDFYEIVDVYRRVSRNLFKTKDYAPKDAA